MTLTSAPCLFAAHEKAKFERAAVRWLGRYLDEGKGVSLLKAHVALGALSGLRSGDGGAPAKFLTELASTRGEPGQIDTAGAEARSHEAAGAPGTRP